MKKITSHSFAYKKILSIFLVVVVTLNTHASSDIWTDLTNTSEENGQQMIKASQSRTLNVDLTELKTLLTSASLEFSGQPTIRINLPMPDGTFSTFEVFESPIMEPELSAKFPEIKTYSIKDVNYPAINGRIDVTIEGFHGIIFTPQGTIYMDPINQNSSNHILVYYKKYFLPGQKALEISCGLTLDNENLERSILQKNIQNISRSSGNELRTYRLAVAATGEYTAFHGGTVAGGLSGIVTSVNRVVGIYEREVDVRMILVANNDLIVFTNAATDPFDNNNTGNLINQSQNVINSTIGSANYDIGHTFSTGAGGLASLGVPCQNGSKASGVTGISQPIGDPFDVDYVAHEMGHQFGGSHTFNGTAGSCSGNRSGNAAFEPGSGTTIMAYAGICGAQDIQPHSDDYFHAFSYNQIIAYTTLSAGNTCPVITQTGNLPPEADAPNGGFTIPFRTPFELTGTGSDEDGDALFYQWEEFDLGAQGAPNSPSGNAPIFRSFSPVSIGTRIFPQISDIVNNTQTIGEILPTYARNLKFRFNVRDNKLGGGGYAFELMTFSVTANAGPFLVSFPNAGGSFEVNSDLTVTWDVANTNLAPVNCPLVNLYLSIDGGFTYPILLLSNTPNDGSETILIPNQITNQARIKVKAADNIFFDISNQNFSIIEPLLPDFFVSIPNNFVSICTPDVATFELQIETLGGFSSPVLLDIINPPAGITVNFSNNNFIPTGSSTLTIGNTASLANGTYDLNLQVSGAGITRNSILQLEVFNSAPASIVLISPENGLTGSELGQSFEWTANSISQQYDFELATDIAFTNIVATYNTTALNYEYATLLDPSTTYFWRVKGYNTCGSGDYSVVYSFATAGLVCTQYHPSDLPKNILSVGTPTVTSGINITDNYTVADVNILNITGTHTYISDLDFFIKSPDGTEISLISGICNDEHDFFVSLDDAAASNTLPCPPTDGNTYRPEDPLAIFYNKEVQGNWIFKIKDNFTQDGGVFTAYTLEVCRLASTITAPSAPTNLTATAISSSQINLSWLDNASDETGYLVERSLTSGGGFGEIVTLNAGITSYENIGLDANTTYFYQVKAIRDTFSSIYTNEANDTTFDVLANSASGLIATGTGNSTVSVIWIDNANNELGFIIERSNTTNSNYSKIDTVGENITSFNDFGLNSGSVFYYKVSAYNAIGNSEYSNEDSALTETETAVIDIEFDNQITVFPNPTSDYLNVNLHHNEKGWITYSLFDATGKLMIKNVEKKTQDDAQYQMNMNELAIGTYLLKIELNDRITQRKIQKF